jgi:hypothetical protein
MSRKRRSKSKSQKRRRSRRKSISLLSKYNRCKSPKAKTGSRGKKYINSPNKRRIYCSPIINRVEECRYRGIGNLERGSRGSYSFIKNNKRIPCPKNLFQEELYYNIEQKQLNKDYVSTFMDFIFQEEEKVVSSIQEEEEKVDSIQPLKKYQSNKIYTSKLKNYSLPPEEKIQYSNIESPIVLTNNKILYKRQMPIAQELEGPVSLSLHKFKDKIIYIFGEKHTRPENCSVNKTKIIDYIENILKQQQIEIDFFLETSPSYTDFKEYEVKHQLDDLRYLVRECIGKTKNKCKFGRNRAHYLDIREGGVLIKLLSSALDDNLDKLDDEENINLIFTILYEIINTTDFESFMHESDDIAYYTDISEELGRKLHKQIERIREKDRKLFGLIVGRTWAQKPDPYTYDELLNDIDKYENIRQLLTDKSTEEIDKSRYKHELLLFFVKLWLYLLFKRASITDIYAIARMLKPYAKNIVVYAGNAHAKNYRNFFKLADATLIKEIRNESGCLDMKDFPQPFFTNT